MTKKEHLCNQKLLEITDINLTKEPYLPEQSSVQLSLKPENSSEWKAYMGTDLDCVLKISL